MPYWAETQTPAMALFPDRAISWGETGGAGVGDHNRNGERKRWGGGKSGYYGGQNYGHRAYAEVEKAGKRKYAEWEDVTAGNNSLER